MYQQNIAERMAVNMMILTYDLININKFFNVCFLQTDDR